MAANDLSRAHTFRRAEVAVEVPDLVSAGGGEREQLRLTLFAELCTAAALRARTRSRRPRPRIGIVVTMLQHVLEAALEDMSQGALEDMSRV